MNQLILDLSVAPVSAFDNFIAHGNEETVDVLQHDIPERFIYLWGEPGSGKTHLLQAWCREAAMHGNNVLYIDAATDPVCEEARTADCIAVDHVESLDDAGQVALFSTYNTLKQSGQGRLLMAGRRPPMHMPVRDDLRTRLGWGLVFEVRALEDDAKLDVLRRHAADRQLTVNDEVFQYLLTHWRRDLPSLLCLLDSLDRYSLAVRRPITIPLLKNLLQHVEAEDK